MQSLSPSQNVKERVLVFGLGGGTFDLSLVDLSIHEGDHSFDVLHTTGNTRLGGQDFDQNLMHYALEAKSPPSPPPPPILMYPYIHRTRHLARRVCPHCHCL